MLGIKRASVPAALLLSTASESVLVASPPIATNARFASPIMSPLREQYGLCLRSPVGTPVTASAPQFSVPVNSPATAHCRATTFFDGEDANKRVDAMEAVAAPKEDHKPAKWKVLSMTRFPGLAAPVQEVSADATEQAVSKNLQRRGLKARTLKGTSFSEFPGISQATNLVKRASSIVIDQRADDNLDRKPLVEGIDRQKIRYPRSPYPSFSDWESSGEAFDWEADDVLRNNLYLHRRAVSPHLHI